MPVAISAAFSPTTPPPKIKTVPGETPGAPPKRSPLPFWVFSKECAPLELTFFQLQHSLELKEVTYNFYPLLSHTQYK